MEDQAGVLLALSWYAGKNIDFADALIAVNMGRRGLAEIFRFDEHFDRLPGITRLQPG
jgi:predicted nucleic acid-binding protein